MYVQRILETEREKKPLEARLTGVIETAIENFEQYVELRTEKDREEEKAANETYKGHIYQE